MGFGAVALRGSLTSCGCFTSCSLTLLLCAAWIPCPFLPGVIIGRAFGSAGAESQRNANSLLLIRAKSKTDALFGRILQFQGSLAALETATSTGAGDTYSLLQH